jgi:hypothetical protein
VITNARKREGGGIERCELWKNGTRTENGNKQITFVVTGISFIGFSKVIFVGIL